MWRPGSPFETQGREKSGKRKAESGNAPTHPGRNRRDAGSAGSRREQRMEARRSCRCPSKGGDADTPPTRNLTTKTQRHQVRPRALSAVRYAPPACGLRPLKPTSTDHRVRTLAFFALVPPSPERAKGAHARAPPVNNLLSFYSSNNSVLPSFPSSRQHQGSTGSPPKEGGGWHDAIDECSALGDTIVSPDILGAAEGRCDRLSHHRRLLVSLCLGGYSRPSAAVMHRRQRVADGRPPTPPHSPTSATSRCRRRIQTPSIEPPRFPGPTRLVLYLRPLLWRGICMICGLFSGRGTNQKRARAGARARARPASDSGGWGYLCPSV
jgi:hypothetical protein